MSNPLLHPGELPTFAAIQPEAIEPTIAQIIDENREARESLLSSGGPYDWDNLVAPMEAMEDRLSRAWSPVRHLNSVMNSPELREAYNACLPRLSAHGTAISQDQRLFDAYQSIRDGGTFSQLEPTQQKVIDDALRDFRLAGVALPEAQKARYGEIMQSLSALAAKFQENVLDATQAWKKHLTDERHLAGLPDSARDLARQNATREGLEGWLLNLEFPCYLPVMTYAEDRALREEVYTAYSTRASDQGPHAGQWDNTSIMEELLALRHELATLLGFPNYAEYSLATKMAGSSGEVIAFLEDLAQRSHGRAQAELDEITAYAREHGGPEHLEAWDVGFYAEKLRQHRYQVSQEELRPYFPETRVVPGLFAVVERLFGVRIEPLDSAEVWHPDVRAYQIVDDQGVRGRFYLDLYARANKRGGAWMDGAVSRRSGQLPAAYLVCNFSPPVGDDPACFTHDEVLTLFHEFGHGLHHLLTRVNYAPISGIHGVEWDAVELPSQFLENWCWEREALDLLAAHYRTGEPLPETLYERMLAAKHFQSAMLMVRQLEFSLFDFRLHLDYDPAQGARIAETLGAVRQQVAVVKPPAFNRFAHGFSHIFAGGYAAGYYSYKWAEVLSADAFSLFEERGIFDGETGRDFSQHILEVGGSRDAMTNFKAFRGREPRIDALLRHSGISA